MVKKYRHLRHIANRAKFSSYESYSSRRNCSKIDLWLNDPDRVS